MSKSHAELIDLAKQGNSQSIALLIFQKLGSNVDVQAGIKEDILLIRLIIVESKEKDLILIKSIEDTLIEIGCPVFETCRIQAVTKSDMQPIWNHSLNLKEYSEEETKLANNSLDTISNVDECISTELSPYSESDESPQINRDNPQPGKWKIPGIGFGNLNKLSGQISEQTLRIAQEAATTTQDAAFKATEQAMRSSINQTMNAFQIAVEEIHSRKLPAKMTALTGTINVGVIQLSIRLDIPMDEETGEIKMEVN
jgi:hypothetical protein